MKKSLKGDIIDMRTREEILEEIAPLIGSQYTVGRTTLAEKIIIELLLDIRDFAPRKIKSQDNKDEI